MFGKFRGQREVPCGRNTELVEEMAAGSSLVCHMRWVGFFLSVTCVTNVSAGQGHNLHTLQKPPGCCVDDRLKEAGIDLGDWMRCMW